MSQRFTPAPSVTSSFSTPSHSQQQWEPQEILNLNLQTDGTYNCSGVKNNTDSPCGWRLGMDTTERINDMLDDMAAMAPSAAIPTLQTLANISLCHHHKRQARGKVTEWSSRIRNSSSPGASTPSVIHTIEVDPPRSHATPARAQYTESPRPASISQVSVNSTFRFDDGRSSSATSASQRSTSTPSTVVEDEMDTLREEIRRLTDRLAVLETSKRPQMKDVGSTTSLRSQSGIFRMLGKK